MPLSPLSQALNELDLAARALAKIDHDDLTETWQKVEIEQAQIAAAQLVNRVRRVHRIVMQAAIKARPFELTAEEER